MAIFCHFSNLICSFPWFLGSSGTSPDGRGAHRSKNAVSCERTTSAIMYVRLSAPPPTALLGSIAGMDSCFAHYSSIHPLGEPKQERGRTRGELGLYNTKFVTSRCQVGTATLLACQTMPVLLPVCRSVYNSPRRLQASAVVVKMG